MPLIWRIWRSSDSAYFSVAARLEPVICRSIAAGEPKFRIWLTMSAGGKEKVVPGKSSASLARSVRT
jgi:hypothetical protein